MGNSVVTRHVAMRITGKALKDYPFYLRPFFWNQKRKYGRVLDAGLLWARVPKLFIGVAFLYGMIDRRTSCSIRHLDRS